MSEQIELQSYNKTLGVEYDDEIEEYHEIDLGGSGDATISFVATKRPPKVVKEHDFFTSLNVELIKQPNRKKNKRKEEHSDIMDVISTELASNAIPIKENFIEIVSNDECEKYLEDNWGCSTLFSKTTGDSEQGIRVRADILKIAPIFPKVLENTAQDNNLFIPIEYVDPVKFADIKPIASKSSENIPKFLNIVLTNLKYKCHHQFSLELLLSSKLLEIYEEYITTQKTLKDLSRNIKVNRLTRNNLVQEFSSMGENTQKDLRFDPTIRKYTEILLSLKEKHLKLICSQKEVIHTILSLWADVKTIREKCKMRETPYELDIVECVKDDDDYDKEQTETFNLEIADLLDKMEFEFVTKYLEYKHKKKNKEFSNYKKDLVKKPKLEINENEIRIEAEKITNERVSKEYKRIYLKQAKDNPTNSNQALIIPLFEFSLKFYMDDVFICESKRVSVTRNSFLSIDFEESFSAQILPINMILTISLCENQEELAEVKMDLNNIQKINNDISIVQFLYNVKVPPSPEHIGSGHTIKDIARANKVRLKSSNVFKDRINTVCELEIKISWDENLNKNDEEIIKNSMIIGNQIKRLLQGIEKPSFDIFKTVINDVYNKDLDKDEDLVNELQHLCKLVSGSNESFSIDENGAEYKRLKLLHLRSNGGFTDVENKSIPLHTSQISTEQLNCLYRGNKSDMEFQYLTEYESADPIELQRFLSAKYVQNLNKNMLKHLQEYLFKKTQRDVIKEFQDFGFMFSNQYNSIYSSGSSQLLHESLHKEIEIQVTVLKGFNLMNRSSSILDEEDEDRIAEGYKVRSLRPFVRVTYRGVSVQTATAIGCFPTWNQTVRFKVKPHPLSSLFISIYDEYKTNIQETSDDEYSTHSRTVHFRYCNRWMGTVEVPMFSVLNLGTVRGTFKVSTPPVVFGYENAHLKDQHQTLINEVNQLIKKDLSFLTVQITSSLSNLGGINGYNQPLPHSSEDDYLIKYLNNFVTEYLNDFPSRHLSLTFIDSSGRNKCITQFLQLIPLPGHEYFPKHPKYRTESALSKSSGMSKSSSSKSSASRRREVDLEKASPTHDEKESLYSAYEGTWKEDGQLTKLINTSLRYVALIPTYEVNDTHAVTLMGMELLKLLYGSPLDHTILLASYFLYLGVKNFIAIGIGLPRGLSSYVLTQYDLNTKRIVTANDPLLKKKGIFSKNDDFVWYVYDASSGERYELRDVSCALKTVHYVFDSQNIWVNIQQSQDCEHVHFDFTKSSDWQPVFDNSIFVMKQPVVTDANLYSQPVDVERLQELLNDKIRSKVQKWRPNTKTIWNRYCSNLIREVLPNWEYWSFNSTDSKPPLGQKLKQLMVTHKVFGFPLNMSYVNTKSVISAVRSTGIHNNDDPNVEFGLAVQVYAYPNNVFSVWVFLASISGL